MSGGGDGTLAFVVWPTHVGAVNPKGEEPIFQADYSRGQIFWDVTDGVLRGRASVQVPKGEWTHVIYCNDPYNPGYVNAQKLSHPLVLDFPGRIDLTEITEDDVKPLAPDPVLHD